MADQTGIEWCDSTFNPWIGCTRVSPACDDCYAARSTPARAMGIQWGAGQQRQRTSESNWELPLRWQRQAQAFQAEHGRRRRVFCASLADVFDNEVHPLWRADLMKLIQSTPDLDWLLLTKRIGNAHGMLSVSTPMGWGDGLPNVWLGITVVNQAEADRDIPKLLATPARVRFLSIEPMLGPIDLTRIELHKGAIDLLPEAPAEWRGVREVAVVMNALKGSRQIGMAPVSWVICGGESGPNARPLHPDWARGLRDQCAAAGVPFLFKQWGEWVPADEDISGGIVPVAEVCGDINYSEGKRVRTQWLSPNGGVVGHSFARIGKALAGRVLDGQTHDGFPEDRP